MTAVLTPELALQYLAELEPALDAVAVLGPGGAVLAGDSSLAAGAVPNTVGGLSGWIANPQALKPGARMPATYLSGSQLSSVVNYLETLR